MRTELSQTADVLKYLQTYGKITSFEAIQFFGATRLSAIIFELRKRGYPIETVMRSVKNRYGKTSNIAVYHLRKE